MVTETRRINGRRASACLVSIVFLCRAMCAGEGLPPEENVVGSTSEKLIYAVSYLGVRCGLMEITSVVENGNDGTRLRHIVVLVRTTKFFDGIYRVRSRLDSFFDIRRMTSIRYEQNSLEKKKRTVEVWEVDEKAMEVIRTKNGETTTIPIETDQAFDPIAFIFRLCTMNTEVGEEIALGLMTSKGVVDTVAQVTKHRRISTKMGKCEAAAVVPEPRDKMMFNKSGSMVVWIELAEPHRPCKIEFDLSFGTLVASLKGVESVPAGEVGSDWENWGGPNGEER